LDLPEVMTSSLAEPETHRFDEAMLMEENNEEIFDDIVANTNPLLAALPTRDDLIMANLYMHPSDAFFNAKQMLLSTQYTSPASDCES